MSLYLQLVKWTGEGARGVVEEGFQARVDEAHRLVATIGGSIKGYWYVADGEWHVANLIEISDDSPGMLVQAMYRQAGSGAIDAVKILRLVDAADVEAAQAIDYRPPGA